VGPTAASLRWRWGWLADRVQDDAVGDLADGRRRACGPGRGPAGPGEVEVAGPGELGGHVREGAGQLARGERAARVVESRAASRALLKLIRPGSSPGGAA
jgi:hypothetical protein